MFDHFAETRGVRRRSLNPAVLAVATASMILSGAAILWAVAWLMSALGFSSTRPPVEITYDPYEDGTTLEMLIQGDVPPPIEDSASPPR